jgi:hypothetical protein
MARSRIASVSVGVIGEFRQFGFEFGGAFVLFGTYGLFEFFDEAA